MGGAPPELRSDRDLVLKHQENGNALHYASAEFRGVRDMVLGAVRQHGLLPPGRPGGACPNPTSQKEAGGGQAPDFSSSHLENWSLKAACRRLLDSHLQESRYDSLLGAAGGLQQAISRLPQQLANFSPAPVGRQRLASSSPSAGCQQQLASNRLAAAGQ